MNTNEPKPMDPERLADLRSRIACGRRPERWFADLLADRDYQEAELAKARAEVTRLRARVRVEAEDVRRRRIVDATVLRFVISRGGVLGHRIQRGDPRVDLVIVRLNGEPIAALAEHDGVTCSGADIAFMVCYIARLEERSSWDILDEMAAMPLEPGT